MEDYCQSLGEGGGSFQEGERVCHAGRAEIAAAARSFRRRALICLPPACVSLGHDCCETVKVLLCASKEGLPVFVVAEEDFQFIQDEAYDAAQFLAPSDRERWVDSPALSARGSRPSRRTSG